MTTAFAYNNPANAGLKDFSGDQLIESEIDQKNDKKEDESPEQEKPKEGDVNNIEGEKDSFNVDNTPDSGTDKQKEEDPNDQNFIKGISDDKDFKNLENYLEKNGVKLKNLVMMKILRGCGNTI